MHGRTPIMLAVENGDFESATLLLPFANPSQSYRDAELDTRTVFAGRVVGRTVPMMAAAGDHAQCLRLLLTRFSATAVDSNGDMALHYAASCAARVIVVGSQ